MQAGGRLDQIHQLEATRAATPVRIGLGIGCVTSHLSPECRFSAQADGRLLRPETSPPLLTVRFERTSARSAPHPADPPPSSCGPAPGANSGGFTRLLHPPQVGMGSGQSPPRLPYRRHLAKGFNRPFTIMCEVLE